MGRWYGLALAWAALVGLPMGGVAYLMDFPADAAALVAVLGGLGAAAARARVLASPDTSRRTS